MINKYKLIIYCILITAGLAGCSTTTPSCCVISSPKINLTGEKTVVERQIVGDYKELEKDSWVVSSVKTTVQKKTGAEPVISGDSELVLAMKIREFHSDKIRDYKDRGFIGEANNGYVEYIKSGPSENDKDILELIKRVIKNENNARKTIFTRTLLNANKKPPTDEEIEAFGRIFAEEQRALAQKNDWIQDESGRWVKK